MEFDFGNFGASLASAFSPGDTSKLPFALEPVDGSRTMKAQDAQTYWNSLNLGTPYSVQALQEHLNKSSQLTGDPWADLMTNFYASNNDLQWLPKYENIGGRDLVTWGDRNNKNDDWTGALGQAFGMAGPWAIAAPAIAAGSLGADAATAAGAMGGQVTGGLTLADTLGGALGGATAGAGATGGTMNWFDELLGNYNVDAGFQLDPSQFNNYTGELLRDLSAGPAGTNLQDLITKFDSLPPGTGTVAKSLLGRIINGSGTASDWTSLLGTLGATGLGVLGANKQSDALTQIANQSRADRAPFLNQSLGWLNNPESYYSGAPAQAAMKGVLHGLSVNGNPANNPTAMASATEAGLRNWQNAVTGFGNIGLSGQDSRNQLLSNAATADRGVTASLASGLGTLTQPQDDLASMIRRLKAAGLS